MLYILINLFLFFEGGALGFFGGTAAGIGSTIATRDVNCAELLGDNLLNTDLKVIDNDDDDALLKEVKKLNQNLDLQGLIVRDKTDISAKIEATETSVYNTQSSVIVHFLIARNLHDTAELLDDWNSNFEYFLNETKRQIDEDVPYFDDAQLRTWRGDKQVDFRTLMMDLKQNIEFVLINDNIKKLYKRVQSLENDLTDLRELVKNLQKSTSCASKTKKLDGAKGGVDFFGDIAKKFPQVDFLAQSAEIVPVVGGILKGVSVLTSAFCYINQNYLN